MAQAAVMATKKQEDGSHVRVQAAGLFTIAPTPAHYHHQHKYLSPPALLRHIRPDKSPQRAGSGLRAMCFIPFGGGIFLFQVPQVVIGGIML